MNDNVYILDCRCGNCAHIDFLQENLRYPFLCTYSKYSWRPLPKHVPINFASECPNFEKMFHTISSELNRAKNPAVKKWIIRYYNNNLKD